jgi:hypothetical protein
MVRNSSHEDKSRFFSSWILSSLNSFTVN